MITQKDFSDGMRSLDHLSKEKLKITAYGGGSSETIFIYHQKIGFGKIFHNLTEDKYIT